MLVAKPDDFHDRSPCKSDRDDDGGDDERREQRGDDPAHPLVGVEPIPDPPYESPDRKHQEQSEGYRDRQVEPAVRQPRPHAFNVGHGEFMRRGDDAEQRGDALLALLPTECTILQSPVSPHDAEGFDHAPAGDPVAVTHPELLGNSDVVEKMLDV